MFTSGTKRSDGNPPGRDQGVPAGAVGYREVLDGTVFSENDLIVVDDRLPGNGKRKLRWYECSVCHSRLESDYAPTCCGTKMSPAD